MKRRLISLALTAVAACLGASAQNYLVYNPDNKAYLGARVGLDVTSVAGTDAVYTNSPGFHIGAVYNIPLWLNLYFEPGLHFYYDTFGTRMTAMTEATDNQGPLPYVINGSIRNTGFRIPFNFGYHFDFTDDISVSVYTGPVLNFNISARQCWDEPDINGLITDYRPDEGSLFGKGGFSRFDLQWQFGVGCTYQQYYITVGGGVGMTNVFDGPASLPDLDVKFRRNTFNLALGYNF